MTGLDAGLKASSSGTATRVLFPLIVSEGPEVELTGEQIYGDIIFP